MELRHFRYFVALAEQLNFTNAAEKVHVTQSTLSHQIKQLEDELCCRLFERVGKRVMITEKGEAFLEHVHNVLREVEQGVKTVRETSGEVNGVIRIGATHTFNVRVIPKCISMFMERYPSVCVKVVEMAGDTIANELLAGELDFGVTYKPENTSSLLFEPLYNEEMVLVVGENHFFAKRRFVRTAELHRQRLVLLSPTFATRALLNECFRMADAEPVVVAEMNAIAPMIELVRMANVAAIVSEHAVRPESARVIPLQSPTPMRTPGLLWRRSSPRSPAARHIATIIRGIVAEASPRPGKRHSAKT